MKTKTLSITMILLAMMLASCGAKGASSSGGVSSESTISVPSIPSIPSMSEAPKPYEDELPDNSNDGVTFHAFCWTYKDVMKKIPAIAAAGYKNVQISPVQEPKGGGNKWWMFYQPLSFSIAKNSSLGSKDDLKAMCDKAEEYHVSVIADIVFNHMANIGDNDLESDGTPKVSPDVNAYESYIYQHRNDSDKNTQTFHHNKNARGSGAVTQYYAYGALPDLNTANSYVQERCYSLLKECIDVGIDGFRFDAAKHIETPDDPDYASNFWPNTLGKAKEYYKQKTNHDLFAYGEILGDPEGGRKIDVYTKLMRVTETSYCDAINNAFVPGKLDGNKIANASYGKNCDPSYLIPWVESHDTYLNGENHPTDARIGRLWAIEASRIGTSPLFFARPDAANSDMTVGKIASTFGLSETIGAVNRFHNRFIGGEEHLSGAGSVFVNERIKGSDKGAVIINMTTQNNHVVTNLLTHLPDGVYYDQISGQAITVYQGCAEYDADQCGVTVLTTTHNLPRPVIESTNTGGIFVDSVSFDVTVKNATTSYYQINDGQQVTFKDKVTITINDKSVTEYTVKVVAGNGQVEVSDSYEFQRIEPVSGKFNVVNINPSYFTDYDLLIWKWVDGSSSVWTDNYEVKNGVLLFDITGIDGFLLAIFTKGKGTPGSSTWGSPLKQSADISKKNGALYLGYFDASGF